MELKHTPPHIVATNTLVSPLSKKCHGETPFWEGLKVLTLRKPNATKCRVVSVKLRLCTRTVTFCYLKFTRNFFLYYFLPIIKLKSWRSVWLHCRFIGQLIINAVSDLQAAFPREMYCIIFYKHSSHKALKAIYNTGAYSDRAEWVIEHCINMDCV